MEKRDFFRLKIGLKIFIKKIFYNEKDDKYYLSEKWNIVSTRDISASGMFILKKDLKVSLKKDEELLIKLVFPMKTIFLIGKIIREESNGFAINFTILGDRDRDKLVNIFYKLSYEKNS